MRMRTKVAGERTVLDHVGTAAAAGAAAFAVIALARPGLLSQGPSSEGQTYYARMYAARALPLAAATAVAAHRGKGSAEMLAVASAAQLGDAFIGAVRRDPRQSMPTLGTAFVFALMALRRRRTGGPDDLTREPTSHR